MLFAAVAVDLVFVHLAGGVSRQGWFLVPVETEKRKVDGILGPECHTPSILSWF